MHSGVPDMFKGSPKNLRECITGFGIISSMLHGCSNLFLVLLLVLTMFRAHYVAVIGWQRVSTVFYRAITDCRLLVRHGQDVSGVYMGCLGSCIICGGPMVILIMGSAEAFFCRNIGHWCGLWALSIHQGSFFNSVGM